MLLDRLNEEIAKELMKVNNVYCNIGPKKIAARLTKVDGDTLVVSIKYKHKKKRSFIFKTISLINKDTEEVIQRRDVGLRTLDKDDSISLTWTINTEQTGSINRWGYGKFGNQKC